MNDTYRSQFRLPFDLADKLRDAAEASGRSMNAEIVARLEASFEPLVATSPPAMERAIRELESLQVLGALHYKLQRASYRADTCRQVRNEAWNIYQGAMKSGVDAEIACAREKFDNASQDLKKQMAEIELVEAQIDDIHLQRSASGLKELRDVEPVYVSVRGGPWVDSGLVTHKQVAEPSAMSEPKAGAAQLPPTPTKRRINVTSRVKRKP